MPQSDQKNPVKNENDDDNPPTQVTEMDRLKRLEESYASMNELLTIMLKVAKAEDQTTVPDSGNQPTIENESPTPRSNEFRQQLLKTLRSQLTSYDGSADVVALDNFCRRLQDYFEIASDTPPTDQVLFASAYLKGTAETWFAATPRDSIPNFSTFKAALILRFRSSDSVHEAKVQLTTMRQNTSARAFLASFQAVCLLIDDLRDSDKIFFFRQGLKPELNLLLATHPTVVSPSATFCEVSNLAVTLDALWFKTQLTTRDRRHEDPRRFSTSEDRFRASVRGSRANPIQVASIRLAVPSPREKMTPEIHQWCRDNDACFFCRKPNAGHLALYCPCRPKN